MKTNIRTKITELIIDYQNQLTKTYEQLKTAEKLEHNVEARSINDRCILLEQIITDLKPL
jgi:hypothetical protein